MTRIFCFEDSRPPWRIQHRLESDIASVFRPVPGEHPPVFATAFKNGNTSFHLRLRLDDASGLAFRYSLHMESSGPGAESLNGWADFWTRDLRETPPAETRGSADAIRKTGEQWLAEDSRLTSTEAVQAEILDQMRKGACYATAHKEGGTTIRFSRGRFVSESYGESSSSETFATPAEFFAYLWRFHDWKTSQYDWPNRVPELDAWKLILRFLEPPRPAISLAAPVRTGLSWILDRLRGR